MVQSIVVLVAFMAMGISCQPLTHSDNEGDAQLKTNIAVLSPNESLKDLMGNVKEGLTVIDPEKMLDTASVKLVDPDEIVEDPFDWFLTSPKGKIRPNLVDSGEDWAEPTIGGRIDSNLLRRVANQGKPLTRVKRCGGGGGGGGDGNNANRPRAGFNRSNSVSRRNNNLTRTTTTTTTRTVIKDGKVISQTVIPQSGVVQHQPVGNQVVAQQQPVVVYQHQPAQQVVAAAQPHVVAAGQPQVVAAQPQVVAHPQVMTAHPQVVAAHPQVVAAQPQVVAAHPQVVAAQPQVAAPAPSISVQGSVKVN